ncbi:MAG: HAD family hydrolase [Gammaproteobacteria bacterium]|nr:HAD family hydrolase [Gammaproteobacteria bacterium]
MQAPKAIFFDLDETLIENIIPIQEVFASMYGEFEAELGSGQRSEFFTALRRGAGALWNTMFEQEHSPEQQLVGCFAQAIEAVKPGAGEQLGEAMLQRFICATQDNVRFHPGAETTLQELRKAGIVTGLITNGIERLQLAKVESLNIASMVDHVTVSAQARAHKPHAPVFELALQRGGVVAAEAWQIGDHALNDVAGAIRVGMQGVFYDPSGKRLSNAFDDLQERPNHTIRHLEQVLELAGVAA